MVNAVRNVPVGSPQCIWWAPSEVYLLVHLLSAAKMYLLVHPFTGAFRSSTGAPILLRAGRLVDSLYANGYIR